MVFGENVGKVNYVINVVLIKDFCIEDFMYQWIYLVVIFFIFCMYIWG